MSQWVKNLGPLALTTNTVSTGQLNRISLTLSGGLITWLNIVHTCLHWPAA